MNLLRRAASLPGFRRVLLRPGVRSTLARTLALRFLLGAFETTQPWRLLAGEVRHRGQTRRFVLRDSGLPVYVLHGQGCEGLYAIFRRGEYQPPAELTSRLAAPARILDIGAAQGMFAAWALGRWPQATVTCIEPEPQMLESLRAFAAEVGSRVELVEAAAGTHAGRIAFVDGWHGGSHAAQGDEDGPTRLVPLIDILPLVAEADLVKLDIEGGEWTILADPRLAGLDGVLTMEYHRLGAPRLPARDAAGELLGRAGLRWGHGEHNHWGHGTLWAWSEAPRAERRCGHLLGPRLGA